MYTFFGYFGTTLLKQDFSRGEEIRIGRWICRVIFKIGHWYLLKKI